MNTTARAFTRSQTSSHDVEFTIGETTFRAEYTVVHANPWKTADDRVVVEDIYLCSDDCEVMLPDFLAAKVLDEAQTAADAEYAS